MPAIAKFQSARYQHAIPLIDAAVPGQADVEPQTPLVRFATDIAALTQYTTSASPFDFTAPASQVTAPDAVAAVTAAPSVAPLSVLSRTFTSVPPASM